MKYKPTCIKCKEKYDSDEPDDYYCLPCNKEKLKIAEKVDKQIASLPSKRKQQSDLQRYDEINKGGFVNVRDLGIKL